jgi:hypothetical protein
MPLACDFEFGANGNEIGAGDTGNPTKWDAVFNGGGTGSIAYDNTRAVFGNLSAKLVQAPTPASITLYWIRTETRPVEHGRAYIFLTAYGGTGTGPTVVLQDFAGSASGFRWFVTSSGHLSLSDRVGSVGTQSAFVSLNQWVRVEYMCLHSATVGQLEVKLFNNPYSTTATETLTSAANRDTLAAGGRMIHGLGTDSPGGYTCWMDAIIANASDYPGPILTRLQPPLASAASGLR